MGFILYVQNVERNEPGSEMRPKLGSWKYGYHIDETLNFAIKMMGRNTRARSRGSGELKMWDFTLIDFQIHQDICKNMCKARWCTVCADCDGKLLLLNVCRVWNVCDRHRSEMFSAHWCWFVLILWFRAEKRSRPFISEPAVTSPRVYFPLQITGGSGSPCSVRVSLLPVCRQNCDDSI
jgi:hypothetical protein